MNERKLKNKRNLLIAIIVFVIFMIIFAIFGLKNLRRINEIDKQKIEALKKAIENEKIEGESIKNEDTHIMNDEDYERIARNELGLIKKNEIIIKPR